MRLINQERGNERNRLPGYWVIILCFLSMPTQWHCSKMQDTMCQDVKFCNHIYIVVSKIQPFPLGRALARHWL